VTRLEAYDISLDVPPGWEARAFCHEGGEPTIHLATFALPPSDGEFGSHATEAMPDGALFLALTEYALRPVDLRRGIFARKPPSRLAPEMLSERTLLRPLPGRRGAQRFFSVAGRGFCLYVVAARAGVRHLDAANVVLASLSVRGRRNTGST